MEVSIIQQYSHLKPAISTPVCNFYLQNAPITQVIFAAAPSQHGMDKTTECCGQVYSRQALKILTQTNGIPNPPCMFLKHGYSVLFGIPYCSGPAQTPIRPARNITFRPQSFIPPACLCCAAYLPALTKTAMTPTAPPTIAPIGGEPPLPDYSVAFSYYPFRSGPPAAGALQVTCLVSKNTTGGMHRS